MNTWKHDPPISAFDWPNILSNGPGTQRWIWSCLRGDYAPMWLTHRGRIWKLVLIDEEQGNINGKSFISTVQSIYPNYYRSCALIIIWNLWSCYWIWFPKHSRRATQQTGMFLSLVVVLPAAGCVRAARGPPKAGPWEPFLYEMVTLWIRERKSAHHKLKWIYRNLL